MPTNAAILNVILAVYDLTWHFNTLNDIMMNHGTGVFHLGVLIMGVGEYSYGERGVCQLRVPGNIGQHVHRVDMPISTCTVPAGTTPEQHVASALCRVAHQGSFYRGGYNLLSRNCINFAEALVMELTGQEIPETFRSAARTGKLAVGALDALSSLGSQLIDLAFGSRHHSPTSAASSSMSSTSASDVILISPAKHAPIHFYTPPPKPCAPMLHYGTPFPQRVVQSAPPAMTAPQPVPTQPLARNSLPVTPQALRQAMGSPQSLASSPLEPQRLFQEATPVRTPARDRSRSHGLTSDVVEQYPAPGQSATQWLEQELGRGRTLVSHGVRYMEPCHISVQRVADLFFGGSVWRSKMFLQPYRQ